MHPLRPLASCYINPLATVIINLPELADAKWSRFKWIKFLYKSRSVIKRHNLNITRLLNDRSVVFPMKNSVSCRCRFDGGRCYILINGKWWYTKWVNALKSGVCSRLLVLNYLISIGLYFILVHAGTSVKDELNSRPCALKRRPVWRLFSLINTSEEVWSVCWSHICANTQIQIDYHFIRWGFSTYITYLYEAIQWLSVQTAAQGCCYLRTSTTADC